MDGSKLSKPSQRIATESDQVVNILKHEIEELKEKEAQIRELRQQKESILRSILARSQMNSY